MRGLLLACVYASLHPAATAEVPAAAPASAAAVAVSESRVEADDLTDARRVVRAAAQPAPQLGTRSTYAPTRDGQRFLFNTWDAKAAISPIVVVVNWHETIPK